MTRLDKAEVKCAKTHECVNCGRPICPNEYAMRVVWLEYTGGRRNMIWNEYICVAHRWPR